MNGFLKVVTSVVIPVIGGIVSLVSPEIRTELTSVLQAFYKKAVSTGNMWDKVLAELAMDILNIPIPQ